MATLAGARLDSSEPQARIAQLTALLDCEGPSYAD
jgi:hypothetical protein